MGKQTELERAANILQNDGYLLGWIREDSESGIVAFFDPATLKANWTGRNVFGLLRISAEELRDLRTDPEAKGKIYEKVKEAEHRLMQAVGFSLALTLLCIYPILG